jgi:hypothetical protein
MPGITGALAIPVWLGRFITSREAVLMSRFRVIVIAAIAAAGLAIGAAPTIAAVAQTHASHPATSRMATSASRASVQRPGGPVMIPDAHCPRGGTEATIYKSGCTDATALNHGSCSAAHGPMPFSPAYIFNGCGVRVWLFTGNLTGTKVCINPGTGNDGAFGTNYHYYQITTNHANC